MNSDCAELCNPTNVRLQNGSTQCSCTPGFWSLFLCKLQRAQIQGKTPRSDVHRFTCSQSGEKPHTTQLHKYYLLKYLENPCKISNDFFTYEFYSLWEAGITEQLWLKRCLWSLAPQLSTAPQAMEQRHVRPSWGAEVTGAYGSPCVFTATETLSKPSPARVTSTGLHWVRSVRRCLWTMGLPCRVPRGMRRWGAPCAGTAGHPLQNLGLFPPLKLVCKSSMGSREHNPGSRTPSQWPIAPWHTCPWMEQEPTLDQTQMGCS